MMHSLDSIEDMAFRPAQRRKTQQRKLVLEFADVVPTQGKIVGKVSGAAAMCFMERYEALYERRLELQHVRARRELAGKLLEKGFVDLHGSLPGLGLAASVVKTSYGMMNGSVIPITKPCQILLKAAKRKAYIRERIGFCE